MLPSSLSGGQNASGCCANDSSNPADVSEALHSPMSSPPSEMETQEGGKGTKWKIETSSDGGTDDDSEDDNDVECLKSLEDGELDSDCEDANKILLDECPILRASPTDAAPAPAPGSAESCPGGSSSSISLKKRRTDVPRKEGDEPLTDDVELFSSDGAFSSGASRPETLHNP